MLQGIFDSSAAECNVSGKIRGWLFCDETLEGGSITDNAPSPSKISWKARRIILYLFTASQLPLLGTETAHHDRAARDIVGLRGRDDAADACSDPTDD